MLSFISYKRAHEQLEIIVDDKGIDELIDYLESVKEDKDHLHLTIGTELDDYDIPEGRENILTTAKKVTIYYEPKV